MCALCDKYVSQANEVWEVQASMRVESSSTWSGWQKIGALTDSYILSKESGQKPLACRGPTQFSRALRCTWAVAKLHMLKRSRQRHLVPNMSAVGETLWIKQACLSNTPSLEQRSWWKSAPGCPFDTKVTKSFEICKLKGPLLKSAAILSTTN